LEEVDSSLEQALITKNQVLGFQEGFAVAGYLILFGELPPLF
jgi:hypothetical protein